jgi:hypothetical protein
MDLSSRQMSSLPQPHHPKKKKKKNKRHPQIYHFSPKLQRVSFPLFHSLPTTFHTPSQHPPHTTLPAHMTIFNQHPLSPTPTMSKPTTPVSKPPSPTNVAGFPTEGWLSTTRPTKCIVPGCIDDIIGYEDYYIDNERALCTHAFSITAVATTIDDGAYPLGSTELNNKTGHNLKMSQRLYTSFSLMVLGIDHDSWATTCTKSAFRNLIIQDIDALVYYYDTNKYVNSMPVSSPGNLTDMVPILARLTLLLVEAHASTPHIINSVWGADADTQFALGGPRVDLSLVCQKILTLSKKAISRVYIWMTNPSMLILSPGLHGFIASR